MNDNFPERLNAILPRLLAPELLSNAGLGSEIGFYVFDYAPASELAVRKHIVLVQEEIARQKPALRVREVNLFRLLLDYLQRRKVLTAALQMQRDKGQAALRQALKGILHEEKIAQEFIAVAQPAAHDLILLTGIGNAWPLLRTHTLLNNLHSLMQAKPLVVFYPGHYDGQTLKLLGCLSDNNYYRAFRLVASVPSSLV